ncbi:MAG: type III-B CRISPR module RAMP protein Cmr6 [Moorellales bacterium]
MGLILPLYPEAVQAQPRCEADSHRGLWYDKFFEYEEGWKPTKKAPWVNRAAAWPAGDRELLAEATRRLGQLVLSLGGELRVMATQWRFVTGLGREHPVENGFAWHPTLGVPYLRGSSVKGVVRAWAGLWAGATPQEVERVFGPEGEDRPKRVGTVIFFDALPIQPVELKADVMTPHYAPYYQEGEGPPGDWFAPVPIPFLTVAPGQPFLFALAPRHINDPVCQEDCRRAVLWLEEALAVIGAGAKTASGYGRFGREKIRERGLLGGLSSVLQVDAPPAQYPNGPPTGELPETPILAEMRSDGYDTDENRFMAALTTKWLGRLNQADLPQATKQEIARRLRDWYLQFRPEQWHRPNKKNAAKIAEIRRYLPDE